MLSSTQRSEPSINHTSQSCEEANSPFADRFSIKTDNKENRALVERLSAWRTILFFCSLIINVGSLVQMNRLPLIVQGTKLYALIVVIIASHCCCCVALCGFRFSLGIRVALSAAYGLFCMWTLRSIAYSNPIELAGADLYSLILIVAQTFVLNLGAHWILCQQTRKPFLALSMLDLVVAITALGILLPLAMSIWPTKVVDAGRDTQFVFLNSRGWLTYLGAFWHSVFNGCLCLLVVNLFLGFFRLRITGSQQMINRNKRLTLLFLTTVMLGMAIGLAFLFDQLSVTASGSLQAAASAKPDSFGLFSLILTAWVLISLSPIAGVNVKRRDMSLKG